MFDKRPLLSCSSAVNLFMLDSLSLSLSLSPGQAFVGALRLTEKCFLPGGESRNGLHAGHNQELLQQLEHYLQG